jgi:hypothetical protein
MNKLEMLYNRYGKKIWLTEFAKCCTRDQAEVETFMKVSDDMSTCSPHFSHPSTSRPSFPDWRLLTMSTATLGSSPATMINMSKL